MPSVCSPGCGDGIKTGSEACDDGNNVDGDGCSAGCYVQAGYSCTGSPSTCTTICGDGLKVGAEQCDDGNTANGDGCSSSCQYEFIAETEVNNTCATANGPNTIRTSALGSLFSGSINPSGDVDWISFTVTAYADLSFETFDSNGPSTCASIDTVLQLFKSDCTTAQSASQDQGGVGNCSRK